MILQIELKSGGRCMKNKELIEGCLTSVEHHGSEENGGRWDEISYEFEYEGIRFEGSSKEPEGIISGTTLEAGMHIYVWFYPDTQEWKIKRKKIIIKNRDEYGNKISTPISVWIGVGISIFGGCLGLILHSISIVMCLMGIGFIIVGIGAFENEVKFVIDKKNGKYKILNAIVTDYKMVKIKGSRGYRTVCKNVCEYIEDGETKRFISPKEIKKRQIGEEVSVYKNISTGEIRKGADWIEGIKLLLISGVVGAFLIFLSILFSQNNM